MTLLPEINITDSEWEVMRIIWSQQEATSSQITAILKEKKNWQPTTVKTLIARLVKKKMLTTQKVANRFIYSSLVSESESWKKASSGLFNHICARKMGKKIALLIEENPLSFADIELIKNSLINKEKFAVADVKCNCIPGQCNCNSDCC